MDIITRLTETGTAIPSSPPPIFSFALDDFDFDEFMANIVKKVEEEEKMEREKKEEEERLEAQLAVQRAAQRQREEAEINSWLRDAFNHGTMHNQ